MPVTQHRHWQRLPRRAREQRPLLFSTMCTWALIATPFVWMDADHRSSRWIDAGSRDVVFPIEAGLGVKVTVVTERRGVNRERVAADTASGLRANLDWLVDGRKIAPHIRVVITTYGYFASILDCDDDCRTGPRCHFATRLFVTADDQGERRVPTHLHLIHMAHQGLASRPGSSRKTARLSQNQGDTSDGE